MFEEEIRLPDTEAITQNAAMNRIALHWVIPALFWAWTAASAETNHDFAKWEPEIHAYEQSDRTNPPTKAPILFYGSSTIRLWSTLQSDFPNQPVLNRGFGGCEIVDCTHFADRIALPYKPRMIFFRCGGNDLWNGKSPEEVFHDYQEFVSKVRAELPETEIVFISWNPTIARWKQVEKERALNGMVERFTRTAPHLKYIETYDMVLGPDGTPRAELFRDDRLHFSAAGYRLLAERVRSTLPAQEKAGREQ